MRLAVTRDRTQLNKLFIEAAARKIEIVPLPLTRQEKIPFEIPSDIDLSKIDWLFFTSAHGVTAFFDRINDLEFSLNPEIKIATVGSKTTETLRKQGFLASMMPSENYGRTMFEEFIAKYQKQNLNCLYARAEVVVLDPANLFDKTALNFYSVICYRTVINRIDKTSIDSLTEQDYLLFTAPSNVLAYNNLFGPPLAKPIAIGHTTEKQMTKLNWNTYAVMNEANVEKVWEYL